MKRPGAAALAILLTLSPALAQELRDHAQAFTLTLPPGDDGNAWRIDLTPAVYAHVHDAALRDIAVFNADGHPVPSARVDATPGRVQRSETVPLLPLPAATPPNVGADLRLVVERDDAGRLRRLETGDVMAAADAGGTRDWIVDASAIDGALERIVLDWDTPADGIVAHFELAVGDDLEHWRPIGGGSVFALRQGEARLDRRDLATGGVRAKYLRLHRSDRGAALAGLRAALRHTAAASEAPLQAWIDAVPAQAAAGTTGDVVHYDYRLPAALPIERVRIELATDNALADVAVYAGSTAREPLARTTAFRLRNGGDSLRNDAVDVAPRTRIDTLRIEARTPIAVAPHVQVAFRPDRFVFLAEGPAPYTLAVGSARAKRPDYPIEAALASLRARLGADWQPPPARIGDGRASGGDAALQAPPAPFAWRRWLLWAVLAAAAALVLGFALSLLRGTRGD